MRIIYFIICSLFFGTSQAQDTTIFGPPGATWYYSHWTIFEPPSLFTFVSEGDTLINGINATILQYYNAQSGVLQPADSLNKFVHTNGNQVFYWVVDSFYLLYDFDALPGDTISSRVEFFPDFMGCGSDFSDGPIDFKYIVDSLGSIVIDGQTLRVQFVSSIYEDDQHWEFSGRLIERIGLSSYSDFWWGRGSACILGGFPGILRCYEDPDIFFKNPADFFTHECDEITSLNPVAEATIPIYPNPSTNFIFLPALADQIHIFNSSGQKIYSYKNQERIDISSLPPNLYFIRYVIKYKWHIEKLVKI